MQITSLPILALTTALCGATFLAARSGATRRAREVARLEDRLEALLAEPAVLPAREPDPEVADALEAIRARLARLETSSQRRSLGYDERSEPVEAEPAPDEATGESAPAPADLAAREELLALFDKVIGPDSSLGGSLEEQERFFELARSTGIVDDLIAELEARVASDPSDLDARMELAEAYVAKLMIVPGGPEQGIWGARAEEQWAQVAERDPMRWDAHFSIGNNYSYYPDFMNKTNDAIASLERALEIQSHMVPEPAHVQTYLSLARMYQRKGKTDQAHALLELGLQRHPGDAQLAAALLDLEE